MIRSTAALLCAFASATAVPTGQTVPASTKIVTFSARTMTKAGTESGSCWTTSIASTRSDAFRCMAGNEIHDPCFVAGAKSVACPTDVFEGKGIVMTLDKPLPPAASPQAPRPWAMLLAGGAKCTLGTGTVVAGYPYYCSGENGVCAAPNAGKPYAAAYFVACAKIVGDKPVPAGKTLAKTLYF